MVSLRFSSRCGAFTSPESDKEGTVSIANTVLQDRLISENDSRMQRLRRLRARDKAPQSVRWPDSNRSLPSWETDRHREFPSESHELRSAEGGLPAHSSRCQMRSPNLTAVKLLPRSGLKSLTSASRRFSKTTEVERVRCCRRCNGTATRLANVCCCFASGGTEKSGTLIGSRPLTFTRHN